MRVIVTGAGSGIGRATAQVLAARGHDVIATARNPADLADLVGVRALGLDVADAAQVTAVAADVGFVDAVVNNAGISEPGPLETYPIEVAQRVFDINFFGTLRMIQAFVPAMRQHGSGTIVNVSSVQGRVGSPLGGIYAATKHAVEGMSESLHFELSHFGIRVVIVEPGYIAPGMKDRSTHGERGTIYEELRHQWEGADDTLVGPGGRPEPELVGRAIAEAIEDESPPLRVPVGADAEMVLATRKQMDDREFEATMRSFLNLTW